MGQLSHPEELLNGSCKGGIVDRVDIEVMYQIGHLTVITKIAFICCEAFRTFSYMACTYENGHTRRR